MHEPVYSPEALQDLDQIWEDVYEVSGDLDTADRYIAGIRNAISQKKTYPETGKRLSYEGIFTGIYYVSFKAYHVFYRIHGTRLEVGRILYAASDYMKTLFGESEYTPEDE